jgi:DNA-binding beta-propeller fold protein YncE
MKTSFSSIILTLSLSLACALAANRLFAETDEKPANAKESSRKIEPSNYDKLRVGQGDGRQFVVTTNQILSPMGEQISFASRPIAVALSPNHRWLGVLGHNRVLLLDLKKKEVTGNAAVSGSFNGIIFSADGKELYASGLKGAIEVFAVDEQGKLESSPSIRLPGSPDGKSPNPVPAGLALDPNKTSLWVVLNLRNSVAEVDLSEGRVLREIPVGNAPYDVLLANGKIPIPA